jgi:tetratricopeptide (TPR) repeat protein
MKTTTEVTFLHLTDLHWGQKDNDWPNVEAKYLEDISSLIKELRKPIDVIFFTGDLANYGLKKEFEGVKHLLRKLYEKIRVAHRALKSSRVPYLLSVPGNHDLERPKGKSSRRHRLTQWSKNPQLHSSFWSKQQGCPYHALIGQAFKNYSEWEKKATFNVPPKRPGLIPGDFAVRIIKHGFRIGVVGLNSSFLQLASGNFKRKLALSLDQLTELCGKDYTTWFNDNHANLLITHHPPDWLAPNESRIFNQSLAPAGRFSLHLFGHMHEGHTAVYAIDGTEARTLLQGRAFSGVKRNGRIHGYSLGVLEFSSDRSEPAFSIFPRRAKPLNNGWHVDRDVDFRLDFDGGRDLKGLSRWRKNAGDHNLRSSDYAAMTRQLNWRLGKGELSADPEELGKYFLVLAHAAMQSFEKRATVLYEEAETIYRRINDKKGEAHCIAGRGDALLLRHRGSADLNLALQGRSAAIDRVTRTRARTLFANARRKYKSLRHSLGELDCIKRSGDLYLAYCEFGEARVLFERVLSRCRKTERYALLRANCLKALGDVSLQSGCDRYETIQAQYELARAAYRKSGATRGEANCLKSLGDTAVRRKDLDTARNCYREAIAIYYNLNPPHYYSIGMTQCALAGIAESNSERLIRFKLARVAWQAIHREDLVQLLRKHEIGIRNNK